MHALMARLWTGQVFSQDIFPALAGKFPRLGKGPGKKKGLGSPWEGLGRIIVPLSASLSRS